MKILLATLIALISVSAIAQPTVAGNTSPLADIVITLPKNSITLTGTASQKNPGHPILDTTWTKISGPAATITHSSNRMTTTVTNLVAGTYVFILTATDKQNSASSTVTVRVLPGTLPIQLAYFNVTQGAGGINFAWRTNMESNNAYFILQKSIDGSNFTDIARISSKAVNGNSSTALDYSFEIFGTVVKADMNNLLLVIVLLASIGFINKLKKVYKALVLGLACFFLFSCSKSVTAPVSTISSGTEYRLKQVDIDGNFSYSAIKVIR